MNPDGSEPRAGGLRRFAGLFAETVVLLRGSVHLRVSLVFWLGLGLAVTEGTSVALALAAGDGAVLVSVVALAWWAFVGAFIVGGAPLLIRPDGSRVDHYGIPNGLSALRAWGCLPLLLCALLSLPGNSGLIIWCIAGGSTAMLDYVDGLVARLIGPVTQLGQAIDPAMDSIFFTMAGYGCWRFSMMPLWLAAVLALRYLGPMFATPLVLLTGRRPKLVHTPWGRRNTAIVGLALFVLMWVRLFNGPVDIVAIGFAAVIVPTTLLHFAALFERTRSAPSIQS